MCPFNKSLTLRNFCILNKLKALLFEPCWMWLTWRLWSYSRLQHDTVNIRNWKWCRMLSSEPTRAYFRGASGFYRFCFLFSFSVSWLLICCSLYRYAVPLIYSFVFVLLSLRFSGRSVYVRKDKCISSKTSAFTFASTELWSAWAVYFNCILDADFTQLYGNDCMYSCFDYR